MYGLINQPAVFMTEDDLKSRSDELLYGWAVKATGKKEDFWYVTSHYGYKGYVPKAAVTPVSLEEIKAREVKLIRRPVIDVLAEPKVSADILLTVYKGSLLNVTDELADGYYKVKLLDGRSGWVSKTALAKRLDEDDFLWSADPEYFLLQAKPDEESFRKQVTETAKEYLGCQYRWAGKSPLGIDCSGLVFMSYMLNGVLLWRDAEIKEAWPVHEIEFEDLRPGDLIYFPGHIAMYLGHGKYINSTGYKEHFGVAISSLRKEDPDYRADLFQMIEKCGSLF
ncbi:C40 family peptidase [Lactobacillus delbrueckii subsp. sunkii]|uniref:C40 family peptidase n=1 Tax=Lactobacillus delbrueckii subsp. allosunkii TaxID=1050107 RepID=A0ABD4SAR2_9LACO|nr:SH3 domain-containing C40 family peptidase [Lactobacillus delbrueckii]MCD5517936.1 C40 family peptidase [Lactobacillus delbrueckii subsp. sunkii]MCT3477262.1 dipeptidyl-peptidase [Lactobacillus delbrueckii subsp. lactis]